MIKHTPHDHPDHGNLQLALGEIKQLADRMNKGKMEADQAEGDAERLREIEATIENLTDVSLSVCKRVQLKFICTLFKVLSPACRKSCM